MGEGPGHFTLFAAKPGEFCEIPDGVIAAAKRAGFTPLTELPDDERPNIRIRPARQGIVPDALTEQGIASEKRNRRNGGESWNDDGGNDLSDGNPSIPAGMQLDKVPELAPPPAPQAPYPSSPGGPPTAAVAFGAKLSASGDMTVETPSDPFADSIAAASAVEMPPAPPDVVADAGQPGAVVQRDTKPDKPSAKAKGK